MEKKVMFPGLKSEMARWGDNLDDLAKIIDTSVPSASRRLRGEIEFTNSEISAICDHYKKSYEDLFKGGDS